MVAVVVCLERVEMAVLHLADLVRLGIGRPRVKAQHHNEAKVATATMVAVVLVVEAAEVVDLEVKASQIKQVVDKLYDIPCYVVDQFSRASCMPCVWANCRPLQVSGICQTI